MAARISELGAGIHREPDERQLVGPSRHFGADIRIGSFAGCRVFPAEEINVAGEALLPFRIVPPVSAELSKKVIRYPRIIPRSLYT